MQRFRISTRGLIIVVAVVGFDVAAMTRAVQQGRAVHSAFEYAVGFGLVLLLLNVVGFGLSLAIVRKADSQPGGRWLATPSPLMIAGFYLAVLALAILSALFFTSGRF